MESTHPQPAQPDAETVSGRHVAPTSPETTEAEDASIEIVSIRGQLADIDLALSIIPDDAAAAIDVLNERSVELKKRLAELQSLFTGPAPGAVDPEERGQTDRTRIIPPV